MNHILDLTLSCTPANVLWRILHDYESADVVYESVGNYLPRVHGMDDGLPESEKCADSELEEMRREWQQFNYDLLEYFAGGMYDKTELLKKYADFWHGAKCFTNHHGWNDGFEDTVLGKNPFSPKGYARQEGVVTGGNVVMQAGEPKNIAGQLCLPVYCIDRNLPPPPIAEVAAKPWLIHRATVCRPERVDPTPTNDCPNGTFQVNPFPHCGEKDVPYPLIKRGGIAHIRMIRLRPLTGAIPSPYCPPR